MFRDKIYELENGVAMGNPISSFMANLFMCYNEMEMSKSKSFPRIWFRYVDDVFAIVNKRFITNTLEFINSKFPSIKFTHELESNNEIAFLDLKIKRNDDSSLSFSIYRKPTTTNRFITSNSHHNFQHKQAAFNCMIHRLLYIPMTRENYSTELDQIYQIADINGPYKQFVDGG